MPDKKLYQELINITENYLGPPSKRFIDRQIQNHLNIKPGELTKEEFRKIIDWIKLAFALLTNNDKIKSDYEKQIDMLLSNRAKA